MDTRYLTHEDGRVEQVGLISIAKGWSTIMLPDGVTTKVRNSKLNENPPVAAGNTKEETSTMSTKSRAKTAKREGAVHLKPNLDNYKQHEIKTPSGRHVIDVDDPIAKQLRGKDLNEVYELAAKKLDTSSGSLKNKYKHLNLGMQRMVLGNMLRANGKAKKTDKTKKAALRRY